MPENLPYSWWRGGKFNKASVDSLLKVEEKSKKSIRVTQGGYNNGAVKLSGGTHDGGGVVDISVKGWSLAEMNLVIKWMRLCGWAAWVRKPSQGFIWHIHGVRIGDKSASLGAQAQVSAYKRGRNGLGRFWSQYADDGPKVEIVTWETSEYNPTRRKPGWVTMKVVRGPLVGNNTNRIPVTSAGVGDEIRGVRVLKWGRWNLKTNKGVYYAIQVGKDRFLEYVKK